MIALDQFGLYVWTISDGEVCTLNSQAIKYLLKLCSHPLLVLGEKISDSAMSCLSDSELLPANADIISELHKLCHSPKLVALKEIMEECGIGLDVSTSETALSVGHHRVLIFAQHRVILFLTWIDFVVI